MFRPLSRTRIGSWKPSFDGSITQMLPEQSSEKKYQPTNDGWAGPRSTTPPITAQPRLWSYSETGRVSPVWSQSVAGW